MRRNTRRTGDGRTRATGTFRAPARRVGRRHTWLSWGALSLAPLLLGVGGGFLALSACTDGDAPATRPAATASPAPREVLRALRTAADRTRAAGSARVSAVMALDGTVSTETTGVLGWSDGLHGTLAIRYTGGTLTEALREWGADATEARYVDGAYYARMGDAFAARTGGRHWIRHDAARGASAADVSPGGSMELLLLAPDVREAGRAVVRGVATTRYAGTVRPAELPTRGPAAERAEAVRERLRAAGITEERIEVWVDSAGRLVKRTERSRTAAGVLRSTAHYRDFGARVTARPAPDPADTVDYEALVHGAR
jgi:hypothetical protein